MGSHSLGLVSSDRGNVDPHTHRANTVRDPGEGGHPHAEGRLECLPLTASEGAHPADTWISDFQPEP